MVIAPDTQTPYDYALRIGDGSEVLNIAASSKAELESWMHALHVAVTAPGVNMDALEGAAVAGPSLATRVKMSMASAVATSSLGQAMLTRYLDPAARDLLRQLVSVVATRVDDRRASVLKSYLLDVAARLLVIAHEGRFPSDTNLDVLYEDTLSFTQVRVRVW